MVASDTICGSNQVIDNIIFHQMYLKAVLKRRKEKEKEARNSPTFFKKLLRYFCITLADWLGVDLLRQTPFYALITSGT